MAQPAPDLDELADTLADIDVSREEKHSAMTVNLKGKHQGKGVDPSSRKEAVRKLIDRAVNDHGVAIVFVQESPWVEKFFLEKHVDISKKSFEYKANGKEAGIAYDKDHFKFIGIIPMGELKPRVDDRILIVKLLDLATQKLFYAISWHGPHRQATDHFKRDLLVQLLNFVQNDLVKQDGECGDFVMAGDFNLDFKEAKKLLEDSFGGLRMAKNDGKKRSPGRVKKSLDYFIFNAPSGERDAIALEWESCPEKMFDHQPIVFKL